MMAGSSAREGGEGGRILELGLAKREGIHSHICRGRGGQIEALCLAWMVRVQKSHLWEIRRICICRIHPPILYVYLYLVMCNAWSPALHLPSALSARASPHTHPCV